MLNLYYDARQEGHWFQALHNRLKDAELKPITGAIERNSALAEVLEYDRPDIVLTDREKPILAVERTVEVPSGHNPGQRFARITAAAQCHVPFVYICPYAARKHGGKTAGPRYMNLRLFHSLDNMARIEGTAIEIINWPVDRNFEVIQGEAKDKRIRAYLAAFFQLYDKGGSRSVNQRMKDSDFHLQQLEDRREFIDSKVRRPDQYDGPPESETIGPTGNLTPLQGAAGADQLRHSDTVLYSVGMANIRKDPYTGMGMWPAPQKLIHVL